jgi:DNA-binding response OmpR family regulator
VGNRSVLVVEDDESSAVFVTRVLERAGFRPSWATDAEEAAVMMNGASYDLLLTDFRLPGRSGLELVQETRSAQPEMGIAVMTSYNERGLERRARALGADDFFEKPLTPATLVARLVELSDRMERSGGGAARRRAEEDPLLCGSPPSVDPPPGLGPPSGADPSRTRLTEAPQRETGTTQMSAEHPVFRRIGPSYRRPAGPGASSVPLWASAAPVVSHMVSSTGPVSEPRTSAAWTFPD